MRIPRRVIGKLHYNTLLTSADSNPAFVIDKHVYNTILESVIHANLLCQFNP